VGLNWNPHGHIPPGVYDLPHFDFHFYIEPIEKIFAISLAEGAGSFPQRETNTLFRI
jgi:hypothetical protein